MRKLGITTLVLLVATLAYFRYTETTEHQINTGKQYCPNAVHRASKPNAMAVHRVEPGEFDSEAVRVVVNQINAHPKVGRLVTINKAVYAAMAESPGRKYVEMNQ